MSYNIIKVNNSIAKEKIKEQIDKGNSIYKDGLITIKNENYFHTKSTSTDKFVDEYILWIEISTQKLNEIFVDQSISSRFKSKQSSNDELVGSEWKPDIEYYLKHLDAKINYLESLKKNIDEFKLVKTNIKAEKSTNISIKHKAPVNKPKNLLPKIIMLITIASAIIGPIIWIYQNRIENIKSEFELRKAQWEFDRSRLEHKIEVLTEKVTVGTSTIDSDLINIWKGVWLTTYENGFSHKLEFSIKNNSLIGYYNFGETSGEIIINEIKANFIRGVWIQESNNKISDSGELNFTQNKDKVFLGTYTKKSENFNKIHSWNGEKIGE